PAASEACAAWMLDIALSRSDFSLEATVIAESSPATRGATVSADSTFSVVEVVNGVVRSPLAELMLMLAVKVPVPAGRRRPMSGFCVAPEARLKFHPGRPLESGVDPGAVPRTVAPAGGVKVALRSAAMPTFVTVARSTR